MANIFRDFPSDYEVRLLDCLPPGGEVYYFSNHATGGDGLIVGIDPVGSSSWVGGFASGRLMSRAHSGVYTCPRRSEVCVVSRGEGYFVDVRSPTDHRRVLALPITRVLAAVEEGLLIFVDPWELFAYGRKGLVWRTGRLAADGINISSVKDGIVHGEGAGLDREDSRFSVRLDTGEVL